MQTKYVFPVTITMTRTQVVLRDGVYEPQRGLGASAAQEPALGRVSRTHA